MNDFELVANHYGLAYTNTFEAPGGPYICITRQHDNKAILIRKDRNWIGREIFRVQIIQFTDDSY